jgi:Undecaprenyl-phosphate galactose phosphotransferase WbaP
MATDITQTTHTTSAEIVPAENLSSTALSNPALPAVDSVVQLPDVIEKASWQHGTRSGLPNVLVYILSDLVGIALALGCVRLLLELTGVCGPISFAALRFIAGFTLLFMIAGWYQGLYSTVVVRPAAELRIICLTSLGLSLLFGLLPWMIAIQHNEQRLVWLTLSALALGIVQPSMRAAVRQIFGSAPWWGRRVLLVGCGERSAAMYRMLCKTSLYGLRPVGFVEDFENLGDADKEGYLGPTAELAERVAEYNVNLGLVATGGSTPRPEILKLVYQPDSSIGEWLIVAEGMGLPCLWTAAREVAGMPALGVSNRLSSPWRRLLKRTLDLVVVVGLMPFWLPLMGVLALLVKLSSPGKAFYSQARLGMGSKNFRCWKLRSMVMNADDVLQDYLLRNPHLQAEWARDHKLKHDPRITWIGKFLRKTSLDELPQLFNVLRGEMSLVGPRPIVTAEIEKYGDVYKRYEMVTPGITGLWQVNGRNNTSYEERLTYDDYYVKNWSLSLDLYIMFCTVKVVLLREGAY